MQDREFGWDDEILDEGGSFKPLPEGDYDFEVVKVERSRSKDNTKNGGLPACNMAKVTFRLFGADGTTRERTENFILHSRMEWKLSQLFLSVGLKKHGEPLRMNWTEIVGKTGKCRVGISTFKKNDGSDGTSNDIKKFYAYDEDVKTVSAQPNMNQPYGYWTQPQYSQPVQNTYNTPNNGGWTPGAF